MRRFAFSLLANLLFITPVFSAQIRIVENNAEIFGVISLYEISRIAVHDDRIRAVAKIPNGWEIEHDEVAGDIYLQPVQPSTAPLSLFITTEQNNSYQLLLEPQDVPSEQILIRNRRPTPSHQHSDARISPHAEEIAELVGLMLRGDLDRRYKRRSAATYQTPILFSESVAALEIEEIWQGARLTGLRIGYLADIPVSAHTLAPQATAVWINQASSALRKEAIIIIEAASDE